MSDVFISYRRSDTKGYAWRLSSDLHKRLNDVKIFMDEEGIPPGSPFSKALDQEMQVCRIVLVLIGPSWLKSLNDRIAQNRSGGNEKDYLYLEIEAAIEKNKLIIPVLFSEAKMPASEQLPESIKPLADFQGFQVSERYWDEEMQRLANQISAYLECGEHSVESVKEPRFRPFVIVKSVFLLAALYLCMAYEMPFDPRFTIFLSAFLLGGYYGARCGFSSSKAFLIALAIAVLTVAAISIAIALFDRHSIFSGNDGEVRRLIFLAAQICMMYWIGERLMAHLVDPANRSFGARRKVVRKM